MKKILLAIVICVGIGMGCTRVDQDVQVDNDSDIMNCEIVYKLSTYLWSGRSIIFCRHRYGLTEEDLAELKTQDKNEALAVLKCKEAMNVIKRN